MSLDNGYWFASQAPVTNQVGRNGIERIFDFHDFFQKLTAEVETPLAEKNSHLKWLLIGVTKTNNQSVWPYRNRPEIRLPQFPQQMAARVCQQQRPSTCLRPWENRKRRPIPAMWPAQMAFTGWTSSCRWTCSAYERFWNWRTTFYAIFYAGLSVGYRGPARGAEPTYLCLRYPHGRHRKEAATKDVSGAYEPELFTISYMVCSRDPSIKRTMCKGCKGQLVPSVTASVVIKVVNKAKKGRKKRKLGPKMQLWTCHVCKCVRRFPLYPKFSLPSLTTEQ